MEETLSQVQLDPVVMSILIGIVTPLLAGLMVKLQASSGIKAFVGVVLVAVNAVVSWVVQVDGSFHWEQFTLVTFTAFATHVFTYLGIWKPAGGGVAAPTMLKTPNVGLGSKYTKAA